MKFIVFVCFLLSGIRHINGQTLPLIPKPVEEKYESGNLLINENTSLIYDGQAVYARYINSYLQQYYGLQLPVNPPTAGHTTIQLIEKKTGSPVPGAYNIICNKNGVTITGEGEGLMNGITTFLQFFDYKKNDSFKNFTIPFCSIKDYPRFVYRATHLDVGRHFFPVAFLKKYIDYLALHKINNFHWHLTEDQGWRIAMEQYPKLTEVAAWRNGTITGRYPGKGNDSLYYGGFYTAAEIKEIVAYATERYINVIPEIDLPGHGSAAIAAYPYLSCFPEEPTINYFPKNCVWSGATTGKQVQQTWGVFSDVFCAGKETTFTFVQTVLDEVLKLFPSKYIHIGGDECPKENWEKCPMCKKRMQDNNLKDAHELQSYFINRLEKYLNERGRIIIGWDEILEGGLAPNAIVMSWRGESGGITAANMNHQVIMSPNNPLYFDHAQSRYEDSVTIGGYNPIEKVYNYNPVPAGLPENKQQYILGAQANMWTEYMKNPAKVEYMLFPRIAALSEVLWTPVQQKNWNDFEKRLTQTLYRYNRMGINYSNAHYDVTGTVITTKDFKGVNWQLKSNDPEAKIMYRFTQGKNTEWQKYTVPVKMEQTGSVQATINYNLAETGKIIEQAFNFNIATGKKINIVTEISPKYPDNGNFTLVDGVVNQKGINAPQQFLGFEGTDCIAVIDLGKNTDISSVNVSSLLARSSWVYHPKQVSVMISTDNKSYIQWGASDIFKPEGSNGKGNITVSMEKTKTRYLKIQIANIGTIPAGQPGEGKKAWLFVDEISVQ